MSLRKHSECSDIASKNVKWYGYSGKTVVQLCKKVQDPRSPLQGELGKHVHTKIYTYKFRALLLKIAPNWKDSICSSAEKWWYVCRMEQYSAIKRDKLTVQVTK